MVGPTEATPPSRTRRNAREEAEKVPLVKRALEVLGATLQRVDEGFGITPAASTPHRDAAPEEES